MWLFRSETVEAYVSCLRQLDDGDEDVRTSMEWAKNILTAYFDRVADHPIVAEAKQKFETACSDDRVDMTVAKIPYERELPPNLPTIDQFEDLARFRRSVRWFADRSVPRAVIDRAMKIAMESPSACNRQPFRYEVFDTHELVQKVGAVPKGTPGWLHQKIGRAHV